MEETGVVRGLMLDREQAANSVCQLQKKNGIEWRQRKISVPYFQSRVEFVHLQSSDVVDQKADLRQKFCRSKTESDLPSTVSD